MVPDFLLWGWVPIFSECAKSLAAEFGCQHSDFWNCHFQSNPGETFFLHLPLRVYDIVDANKSRFLATVPLPHFIQVLKTKPLSQALPGCFRANILGYVQIYTEVFALEEFRLEWQSKGLTGADFRRLM